jgi:hypothetical protein
MKHTDPHLPPCLACLEVDISWLVGTRAASLGLDLEGSFEGEHLKFPDGRELRIDVSPDPPHWREVELDRQTILRTATEMIDAFAAKHGPGKIWTLLGLPLVHIVNDDGHVVRDGKVRLRRLLAHEATATTP